MGGDSAALFGGESEESDGMDEEADILDGIDLDGASPPNDEHHHAVSERRSRGGASVRPVPRQVPVLSAREKKTMLLPASNQQPGGAYALGAAS